MNAESKQDSSSISARDIRAGLVRVLGSKEFQRSPRLSSFLKYIVEMTLEGSAKQIKGYTIGIEVFGKPDSFDPEQDASVRVDATRLRRVLAAYYSGPGRDDPIKISVATGTYVPSFERQSVTMPEPGNWIIASLHKFSASAFTALGFAIFILGGVIGVVTFEFLSHHTEVGLSDADKPPTVEILKRPTGATVAVLPLNAIGNTNSAQLADGFTQQLLNDLTRFKSLRMLGRETVKVFSGYNLSPYEIAIRLKVNYVVEGSLQRSGDLTRIKVRMMDIASGTYIWSFESDENIRSDNLFQFQSKIIGEIAARLGQPYGVIQRMEARRLKRANNDSLIPYKCVLAHYAYASNKSAEKHAQMRDCLEKAVKESPNYTEAWALLSWIYGDEIRYRYNLRTSKEDALKRADEAATKALDINPESPKAHQYAASVALLKNDIPGVRRHLKIALALNPNDADILADAGWTFAQFGEWEFGRSLVEKAIYLNPGHPPWYHGILFAYYYHHENYERALTHALAFYQPDVLLASVALAAVYGKLGNETKAAEAIGHIADTFPGFIDRPGEELHTWHFPDDYINSLIGGLKAAGLELDATG